MSSTTLQKTRADTVAQIAQLEAELKASNTFAKSYRETVAGREALGELSHDEAIAAQQQFGRRVQSLRDRLKTLREAVPALDARAADEAERERQAALDKRRKELGKAIQARRSAEAGLAESFAPRSGPQPSWSATGTSSPRPSARSRSDVGRRASVGGRRGRAVGRRRPLDTLRASSRTQRSFQTPITRPCSPRSPRRVRFRTGSSSRGSPPGRTTSGSPNSPRGSATRPR